MLFMTPILTILIVSLYAATDKSRKSKRFVFISHARNQDCQDWGRRVSSVPDNPDCARGVHSSLPGAISTRALVRRLASSARRAANFTCTQGLTSQARLFGVSFSGTSQPPET